MERNQYLRLFVVFQLFTRAIVTAQFTTISHNEYNQGTEHPMSKTSLPNALEDSTAPLDSSVHLDSTVAAMETNTHMQNSKLDVTGANTGSNENEIMETTVSINAEEEDDLRGLDMDLPDLPEECKYVTEMERETGIHLGEGLMCQMNIAYYYYDIFWHEVSDDCFQCRCKNICPGMTSEEIEKEYDRMVAELGVTVIWDTWNITYMVTYCTTTFVGLFGNLLVLITVFKIFRPISVTNMFIASLAIADLLASATVVPIQAYLRTQSGRWILEAEWCKLQFYAYYAFFMASVFSLTAMSLERFFVICYPMKAQYMSTPRRAKIILAIVWPLAFTLAMPVAFQVDKLRGECRIRRERWADDDWAGELFIYITVAIFVIPACVIGYAYVRTSMALLASIKKAKGMKNEKDGDKKKESKDIRSRISVIRMLIAVWIVFIVCWGPYLIFTLIDIYANDWMWEQMDVGTYNHVMPALEVATFVNSALNPLLYAFMSRKFRRGFIRCFLCCLEVARKPTSTTDTTSGFSRATRPTTTAGVSTVAASVK